MPRSCGVLLLAVLVAGCPSYDRYTPLVDQDGLVPADQYAQYGREQAQAVAIGREFGAALAGHSPEAYAAQVDAALAYARGLPDVTEVAADTVGHRLTVTFRSGWRTAVLPIRDGKRGADTPGVPSAP